METTLEIGAPAQASSGPRLVADDITRTVYLPTSEQFSIERAEVEDFQLRAIKRRFEELAPQLTVLRDEVARTGVTKINTLNDLVPLLFSHAVYKSYPMSILENRRFDMLTRWLQRSTTVDLSGANVSKCTSIDDWLNTLERETAAQVYHTSGTTGKLSFFTRTALERDLWNESFVKIFEPFRDEPGINFGGRDGARMPVIYPSLRYGRYMAQRLVKYMSENIAPTVDECYTLNNGTLSADIVALSGRIRVAQAKGEVSKLKLDEGERTALKNYMADQERKPQEMAEFFNAMLEKLRGKRVFLFSQTSYLVQAAREGLARGIHGVFAPDSCLNCGGGGKGVVLPDDWPSLVRDFTGIPLNKQGYGMTELTGSMGMCPHGHYHINRYIIPFLLTPDGRSPLPREGRQTGRLGAFDLAAQNMWGGLVTGDKVTIDWDNPCPCGRKGSYLLGTIGRIEENVSGDDKVSCAATIDNTDAALQALLSH